MSGTVFHFPDGTVGPGRWEPTVGAVVPDTDQWWYWTPEWQAGERQTDAEIAAGRVQTFNSVDELLEWLAMTDDPKGPIEDDLEDPAKQDPSPDLPGPVEGNDDEDDSENTSDIKQDGQTG